MKHLNPDICLKLRVARRAAKLSQKVVAAEVGCLQSALSMFEQGDGTKLSAETVERLAKKFGVSLEEDSRPPEVAGEVVRHDPGTGFCPNPRCPSNLSYQLDGRDFHKPDRMVADPVGGRFCAMCGEVLERLCPGCGAPVHAGAFCSFCGDPYVSG